VGYTWFRRKKEIRVISLTSLFKAAQHAPSVTRCVFFDDCSGESPPFSRQFYNVDKTMVIWMSFFSHNGLISDFQSVAREPMEKWWKVSINPILKSNFALIFYSQYRIYENIVQYCAAHIFSIYYLINAIAQITNIEKKFNIEADWNIETAQKKTLVYNYMFITRVNLFVFVHL